MMLSLNGLRKRVERMLEEKQIRYQQYLADVAGRKLEISEKGIMLDRWTYPFLLDENGYKNTVHNLQLDISFNRQYGK